ncbi:fibroblast growth factor 7 isoform X1 [Oncorhynchus keta]|nr:fibroblast growth factor 7 isoform X1 [Oncorhynchus keta]
MPRWMPLPCNLPNLLSALYLHIIFLLGSVCVVCSNCTPEQLAAIMNCSKHERHARNYDYMEGGDVRIRQLFSRTQWFLTVDDYGNINGTQDPTNCYMPVCWSGEKARERGYLYQTGGDNMADGEQITRWNPSSSAAGNGSILEVRTVSEGGVLAIKGVKSQYYISMNRTGLLQGKKIYNENCNFKEIFLENYFNAYSSVKSSRDGKEMFIALSQKGRPLRGKKTRREHIASHFIPMKCREEERTGV